MPKSDKKLSVLQINALGATLSTGRTTREMHNYFLENNIDSYIACPTNKDCNDAFVFNSLNLMRLNTLLAMITGLDAYHSSLQTRKLLKYISKINPDIVHLRVLHNNCINIGMLLKYLAKHDIATVITLHDFWFMTGKCCLYTGFNCDKWQRGCGKCPALPLEKRRMLFDRTSYMWKNKNKWLSAIKRLAVVGVSDWTVEEAKKSYLKNAKIVRRIYNWIDLSVFYPRDTQELRKKLGLEDKFVILGVSTFWKPGDRKGFDYYLELSKKVPDNYHIILIGQMYYDDELPSNITSIARTDNADELAMYYSLADVYLNLSLEETFGKVSAEAVSCGTPVVAFDSTANKEIVPSGGGMLIDDLLCDKILEALKQLEKKSKSEYINVCRQFAEENFDKITNIKEYINLYNELIKGEK